ncbi:transposase [Streptomyces sp. R41]|uniref:Transposase n=1 Tax=Streptomyces sp. R41 TaxID=3238632 RepID=A0AB39R2L2_9ACTN
MPERRRYPSDLSDARWELIEPVLTAWWSERRGRGLDIGWPPDHDLRSLLDVVLYVNRTGIPGATSRTTTYWNSVYAYFARWQEEGPADTGDPRRRPDREFRARLVARAQRGSAVAALVVRC